MIYVNHKMINFSEAHPFQNAVGNLLLFNRGKRDKSKWKLDDNNPFDDYEQNFLPKINVTSDKWCIKCGRQPNGMYIIG